MKCGAAVLMVFILIQVNAFGFSSEAPDETGPAKVLVREHPKTGKPYVVITAKDVPDQGGLLGQKSKGVRPDYRLLDPKVKSGQIPYEGPTSDRKKVYILAASLATIGVVGGTAIIAAAPVATGTGAAGGAAGFGAAGGAVAAGTIATAYVGTEPNKETFTHVSESKKIENSAVVPSSGSEISPSNQEPQKQAQNS